MVRPSTASRQRAETRGRRAETIAALYLRAKGYRILATRARTPAGEIDLIAKRGRTIAFVEVKLRPTIEQALTAVSDHNWHRIGNCAANWMARKPLLSEHNWRYDLIAMAPRKWPAHKADYWRP